MFRIARVRIRWINPDERSPSAVSTASIASSRILGRFAPWNWRARVRWVGFGPLEGIQLTTRMTAQEDQSVSAARPARLLRTFDLPNMRLRVSWTGSGSVRFTRLGTLILLVACVWLGLFALTRPDDVNNAGPGFTIERVDPEGLDFLEVNLGGEMIRMGHSPLDIGGPQDAFDNNIDTLMRGREDNPFILDFEFSEPQPISGVMMDFGRMDFILRVQVYGNDDRGPILYEDEYRGQPEIPHADIDFLTGPEQVWRIYIEIEQLNPPEEVHIHVREVVLKEKPTQEP